MDDFGLNDPVGAAVFLLVFNHGLVFFNKS